MTTLPPLVEPSEPLTAEEFARYSRHVLLPEIGELGQRRLKGARVLVIGAGGLGAPALQYLAGAGVGTIGIIDDDVVDETNLQRQIIHKTADIGTSKVDSAVRAIHELNPLVRTVPHQHRLTEENAIPLFSSYDLILDGTDNFPTRYVASDAAAAINVPILWASVLGFNAQVSMFWSHPPDRDGVTLRDLFPQPPPAGAVPSCSQAGVLGAMVGQVGSLMAAEAVKLLIGVGQPLLGRVLVFDQLRTTWASLPVRARSGAPPAPLRGDYSLTSAGSPRALSADGPPPPVSYTPAPIPGSQLVDVREEAEVAHGMIPGARHIPLALILTVHGRGDLDPQVPVVLYCEVGPRAERAARELSSAGFSTHVLRGGYQRWVTSNTPALAKGSK